MKYKLYHQLIFDSDPNDILDIPDGSKCISVIRREEGGIKFKDVMWLNPVDNKKKLTSDYTGCGAYESQITADNDSKNLKSIKKSIRKYTPYEI